MTGRDPQRSASLFSGLRACCRASDGRVNMQPRRAYINDEQSHLLSPPFTTCCLLAYVNSGVFRPCLDHIEDAPASTHEKTTTSQRCTTRRTTRPIDQFVSKGGSLSRVPRTTPHRLCRENTEHAAKVSRAALATVRLVLPAVRSHTCAPVTAAMEDESTTSRAAQPGDGNQEVKQHTTRAAL